MITLILSTIIVFIFFRLIMSSNKFGYWGNVIAYAILSSFRIFLPGFSINLFNLPMEGFIGAFITYFIIGLIVVFLLSKIDDKGSPAFFIFLGIVFEVLSMIIIGLIASVFMNLFS